MPTENLVSIRKRIVNFQTCIFAGSHSTFGLKTNVTVVTIGNNFEKQCNTGNWRDIVVISADLRFAVGLKADNTVVAVGWNDTGQCNTQDWRDIGPVFDDQRLKWEHDALRHQDICRYCTDGKLSFLMKKSSLAVEKLIQG